VKGIAVHVAILAVLAFAALLVVGFDFDGRSASADDFVFQRCPTPTPGTPTVTVTPGGPTVTSSPTGTPCRVKLTPTPSPIFCRLHSCNIPCPTPKGTPTSTNTPGGPTKTPTLTHTPCSVTVTPTFTPTAPAATDVPEPEKVCGDANQDGLVNGTDALLILQLAAGMIGTVQNRTSADVNIDRAITAVDAALILQADAGIIETRLLVCL